MKDKALSVLVNVESTLVKIVSQTFNSYKALAKNASNEAVMRSAGTVVGIVAGCGIAAAGLLYLLMGWLGRRSSPAVLPEGMDGAGARVHQSARTLLFENVLNSGCLLLVQFLFIELFASRWQTLDAYEARRVVLDELIKYQASAPEL